MSIKIFNGVRFNFKTLDEAFNKFKTFRTLALPLAQAQEEDLLSRLITRRIDMAQASGYREEQPLMSSWETLVARQRGVVNEQRRDPQIDFSFSLVVIPTDSSLIGAYYTEQESLRNLFFSQDWVEDYHYQNVQAKPLSISQFEWECREKLWSSIDLTLPMMYSGFTYTVSEVGNYMPNPESILNKIPSLNERTSSLAADLSLSEHFKLKYGESTKLPSETVYQEAESFLKDPANASKIQEKISQLLLVLKDPLTNSDLIS